MEEGGMEEGGMEEEGMEDEGMEAWRMKAWRREARRREAWRSGVELDYRRMSDCNSKMKKVTKASSNVDLQVGKKKKWFEMR